MEQRVRDWQISQSFSNTAWAFAKLEQLGLDDKLLASLALAAELWMSESDAQAGANTAWTFAKLGRLSEKLFAWTRDVDVRMSDLEVQHIASTSWALAELGQLKTSYAPT
eukprot:gnl/TRDRNA2_/TRDRNA2_176610_c0_seq7.p1 gnl/TRDRNA2_/TRDRNA2_176610_c0~~gnl/TRDRNA2_/TRDRNA2_176610_c0_seq7.p1  ORF type:complete len:110 (+),score=19.39 gnl/TRDRNA2_/TRDRNA2_176610_c0_seq7:187-516(+)